MLQTEVLAAREDEWVIAGVVSVARTASVEGYRVVQEPRIAFADLGKAAEEIGELLGEVAVVLSPAVRGVFVVVAQSVVADLAAEVEDRGELVADPDSVFS